MSAHKGFAPIIIILSVILLIPIALLINKQFLGIRTPWDSKPIFINDGNVCPEGRVTKGPCSTPTPISSPDETTNPDQIGANWKTYENEKFSIKYPQDWTIVNSDKNADISFRSWNYSEDAAPNVLKGYQITLYIGKGYGTDAPKLGVVDSQTINWIGKTAYLEKNTWEGAFVRLRIDQTNQDVLMAIATPPLEKPLFKTFEDNKEVIMTAANSLKLK